MNFWAFGPAFLRPAGKEFTGFLKESGDEKKSECYIPTVVDQLIRGGHADCPVLRHDQPVVRRHLSGGQAARRRIHPQADRKTGEYPSR